MAISSALILAVGVLIRPQPENADPGSIRTPSEIVRLERLTQRRSVEDFAEYFAYVAGLVEESVLLLDASGHTGLIWESDSVLTAARRGTFPAVDRTVLGGDELELAAEIAGPHLPYVLLRTPVDVIPSQRVPVRFYSPGSWLVAVWRTPEGSMRYATGHLLGIAERSCSGIDVTEALTNFQCADTHSRKRPFRPRWEFGRGGAGLRDRDDRRRCRRPWLPPFVRATRRRRGWSSATAMRVDTATRRELTYFQRRAGVIVRELWSDYGAYHAGLLPGDFILSIDGQDVETVADLERLTLPVSGEMIELDVWRAGGRREFFAAGKVYAGRRVVSPWIRRTEDGLPIVRTDNGSLAERAGARAGDRLIAVNQTRPQSFAEVDQAFASAPGGLVHLVFER